MQESQDTKTAKDDQRPQQVDPPIIVGGGGSTLIWIKKTLNPTQVDPTNTSEVPANAPGPPTGKRNLYYCYKCPTADTKFVTVHDGTTGNPRKPVDPRKHKT